MKVTLVLLNVGGGASLIKPAKLYRYIKPNIQRGNVSVMVSNPWTVAPLNQKRLDKTPVPRRGCTYSRTCICTEKNN